MALSVPSWWTGKLTPLSHYGEQHYKGHLIQALELLEDIGSQSVAWVTRSNYFHNGHRLFPLFTWSWMNAQRDFQRDCGRDCDRSAIETEINLDVLCLAIMKEIWKRYIIYTNTHLIFFILESRFIFITLYLCVCMHVYTCVYRWQRTVSRESTLSFHHVVSRYQTQACQAWQ